jgi:hypothetical protein
MGSPSVGLSSTLVRPLFSTSKPVTASYLANFAYFPLVFVKGGQGGCGSPKARTDRPDGSLRAQNREMDRGEGYGIRCVRTVTRGAVEMENPARRFKLGARKARSPARLDHYHQTDEIVPAMTRHARSNTIPSGDAIGCGGAYLVRAAAEAGGRSKSQNPSWQMTGRLARFFRAGVLRGRGYPLRGRHD